MLEKAEPAWQAMKVINNYRGIRKVSILVLAVDLGKIIAVITSFLEF